MATFQLEANTRMQILLLEDQGLVRAGMRALINMSEPEAHVKEASTADEAISHLDSAGLFDIAFLDIDLKGSESGLDVLRHIQQTGLETRPVMLSGRNDRETVMQCLSNGASGYIVKDMDSNGLFRRALDTVLQGGIFLPASVMGRGGFNPVTAQPTQKASLSDMGITGRLGEVLHHLCQGLSNKAIARKMGIEEKTVRNDYNTKLFRVFRVTSRTELIVEVARRGIVITAPAH